MKIFISWSGKTSHFVAKELAEWLKIIESNVETFVSSQEIAKGSVWFHEISAHLKDSAFGIVVLTPENLGAPWIYFEAGALFRGLTETRVIPFLVGVSNSNLVDEPLAMFQTITPERGQVLDLLRQINNLLPQQRADHQLSKLFDKMWPELEAVLNEAKSQMGSRRGSTTQDLVVFGKTQWELNSLSRGIFNVVDTANELRMAGGTFKTFCDDARNLNALKSLMDRGSLVKLLVLHPSGEAVSMLAKMRKDYSPRTTEDRLKAEIELSIDRMRDVLGDESVQKAVRLYRALPRYGLCISDQYATITLYMHGHGASSPSFTLRTDDAQTKLFCDALTKGFDDSWSSNLSSVLELQ